MRALALLSLLALAACDTAAVYPPEGPVHASGLALTVDRTSYDRGDDVALSLRNDGDVPVYTGILGCALLERRTEAGWSSDLAFNERACIAIAVEIEPGESLDGTLALDGVRTGTYRFRHGASGVEVATASFVVR
jgi:hypothetical protein